MQDFMLDLETLGSRPGCAVVSIGVRAFNPQKGLIGEGLYRVISRKDCLEKGLFTEKPTMDWWGKQSLAAQKVLFDSDASNADDLSTALRLFNEFLWKHCNPKYAKIWGNGSDFDNAIISHCFQISDIKPAWSFWNNRCYRTLKSLAPNIPMERTGTYHNALDDATSQAIHANEIFKFIYDSASHAVHANEIFKSIGDQ